MTKAFYEKIVITRKNEKSLMEAFSKENRQRIKTYDKKRTRTALKRLNKKPIKEIWQDI